MSMRLHMIIFSLSKESSLADGTECGRNQRGHGGPAEKDICGDGAQ